MILKSLKGVALKRVVLMRTPGLPEWIWDAMAAGAFSSVHIPLVVFAVHLVPDLRFGYPLVLLPLLLAGPLATRGLGFGRSLIAAPLAGALSGAIAAVSLAIGSQVLGLWVWGLNSAASAPPMPPLPRVMLLPAELMTWAQQDVLFFQPVVALALSLAFLLLRRAGHPIGSRLERYLPRSLR